MTKHVENGSGGDTSGTPQDGGMGGSFTESRVGRQPIIDAVHPVYTVARPAKISAHEARAVADGAEIRDGSRREPLYVGGTRESNTREFHGENTLLVPVDQEDSYLAAHGMERRVLPNGAVLLGANRDVADEAYADVQVSFASAAKLEPEGKKGITHVVEHLVGSTTLNTVRGEGAQYGIGTSLKSMIMTVHGQAHTAYKEYGIWPLLSRALPPVTMPSTATEKDLAREKGRILAEMKHRTHGYDDRKIRHDFFLEKQINHPDSPSIGIPFGSREELEAFTLDDVRAYHNEIFNPRGVMATAYAEGDATTAGQTLDILQESLGMIPPAETGPVRVTREGLHTMSPNYEQGAVVSGQTGRTDQQHDIYYLWAMDTPSYSVQDFGESALYEAAKYRMQKAFKAQGKGYAMANIQFDFDDRTLYGFRFTLPEQDNIETLAQELYPQLRAETFEDMDDASIRRICEMNAIKIAATPVRQQTRLRRVVSGLENFGRVFDADAYNTMTQHVTPNHLQAARDRFIDTPPTIIVEK